jgi:DNA-binding transcriptional MerR regulator
VSEDLLSIGRFARLCRLSVKQLRHYDELGLLSPAWVDPGSGYRYYRPGQARDALAIGLLRSLDVPLTAIGEVLAPDGGGRALIGEGAARVLGEVRDRLEAEVERRRRALDTLDRVLKDGLPDVPVTVVEEPARRALIVRDVATTATIAEATSRCVARAVALVPPPGEGGLIGLFPLDLGEQFPIGVAACIDTGDDVLDGGRFAAATHIGPYDQIPLTAHALLAWCGDRGHVPGGSLREVYLSDPGSTPQERLATRLMIKLEDVK